MDNEEQLDLHAPLGAYLQIAENFYREDKLDAAMQVVSDAFGTVGWPPGLWTAFYYELISEKDARDSATLHQIDEQLSIELDRNAPEEAYNELRVNALEARKKVEELLGVELKKPVVITVFLPDAPLDFIVGSHGYFTPKFTINKICIPQSNISSLHTLIHEFTHAASHELAGREVPSWLEEGLATYVCGDLSNRHVRFVISTVAKNGKLLSISHIENALNSSDLRKDNPGIVEDAYYLAGSLVSYWAERFGFESVCETLVKIGDGQDIEKAFHSVTGTSLRDLERDWRDSLEINQTDRHPI